MASQEIAELCAKVHSAFRHQGSERLREIRRHGAALGHALRRTEPAQIFALPFRERRIHKDDLPSGLKGFAGRLTVRAFVVRTSEGVLVWNAPSEELELALLDSLLRDRGIDQAEVRYFAFDNLRDVRPSTLVGESPNRGRFFNSVVVALETEINEARDPSPFLSGYMPSEFELDPPGLKRLGHSTELMPGVVILETPGLTPGNASLAVHTGDGVEVISSNGIFLDVWSARESRSHGLADHARGERAEVLPFANVHDRGSQYASMVLERSIADRRSDKPEFFQIQPTSVAHRGVMAKLRHLAVGG